MLLSAVHLFVYGSLSNVVADSAASGKQCHNHAQKLEQVGRKKIGLPTDSSLVNYIMGDQGSLYLCSAHSVATHVDHIIHTTCAAADQHSTSSQGYPRSSNRYQ